MSRFQEIIFEFGAGIFFSFLAYRSFFDTKRFVNGFLLLAPGYQEGKKEVEFFATCIVAVSSAFLLLDGGLLSWDVFRTLIFRFDSLDINNEFRIVSPHHLKLISELGVAIFCTWFAVLFLHLIYIKRPFSKSFELLFYPSQHLEEK